MIAQAGPIIQLNNGLPASKMTISSSMEMPRMAPSDQGPRGEQRSLAVDLFTAIRCGDNQSVIELATKIHHLDSHIEPDCGGTPLLEAARCGVSAFRALLSLSDPLLRTVYGASALFLAARGSDPFSTDRTRLLLPLSDPLAITLGDDNALHGAIETHAFNRVSLATIELLLPVSDLAQVNRGGMTPLAFARRRGCDDAAELILHEEARREAAELALSVLAAPSTLSHCPRL